MTFMCVAEWHEQCHLHSSAFRLTLLPLAPAGQREGETETNNKTNNKKKSPMTDGPAACLDICLPLSKSWQEEVWLQCDRLPRERVLTLIIDVSPARASEILH